MMNNFLLIIVVAGDWAGNWAGNWGGQQGINADAFPAKMEIDYVRVYQLKDQAPQK